MKIQNKEGKKVAASLLQLKRLIAKGLLKADTYFQVYRERVANRAEKRKDGKIVVKAKITKYPEKKIAYKATTVNVTTKGYTVRGKKIGGGSKTNVKLELVC